jgi:predicted O-methyltransferase YrrM
VRKAIYTLCVNDYEPAITALTFPLMEEFAKKIGADFIVIKDRKFPGFPIVYEKLQLYELAQYYDWNWFFDADALIHPEMYDVTELVPRDTIFHNGTDFASIRWTYDDYFRRDGRHISSCNWCTGASDWCRDLWHPLEDLSLAEAVDRIHITVNEDNSGFCQREHLIDDYTLSRNIARYGLKATTIAQIIEKNRVPPYLWHKYTLSTAQKVKEMLAVLSTPAGTPAFGESGTLMQSAPGAPPVIKTIDGRIVQACGLGWQIMTEVDLREFAERYPINGTPPVREGAYAHPVPEIEGWMTNRELDWLYEQGKTYRTIAEIGCWFGRSTHALLSGNFEKWGPLGRIVAVDHFLGSPAERETNHAFAKTGNVQDEFIKNCGGFDNLHLLPMDSQAAAAETWVDLVFLDGDHTAEGVLSDLRAWYPKVRPGGMIAGHDINEESVRAALSEFFRAQEGIAQNRSNLKIVPGTSIWYTHVGSGTMGETISA